MNWFPGHMKKAHDLLCENIEHVDLIIEILDARAPRITRNPLLSELKPQKKRLFILNKSDLVRLTSLKKEIPQIAFLENNYCIFSHQSTRDQQDVTKKLKDIAQPFINKRGLARFLIAGVPNVGKSSFLNRLSKHRSASVANKPGHTRGLQTIRWGNISLLDTPGLLWGKLNSRQGEILSLLGCIKEELLPAIELAQLAYEELKKQNPALFHQKKNLLKAWSSQEDSSAGVFNEALHQDALHFLREFRAGFYGRYYFHEDETFDL